MQPVHLQHLGIGTNENAMGQYNRIADEILTLDTLPEL